jgi:hypothetical protein
LSQQDSRSAYSNFPFGKERVMQQLVGVRRFVQQPLMVVFGVLTGAGAAKSGHGAWAVGAILTFLSIYFGAVVTFMMTRSLAAWIARMQRYEQAGV